MAETLIIKIDGDASGLERELEGASGSGVRAFKKFGDESDAQMNRINALANELQKELSDIGKEGEASMKSFGDKGQEAVRKVRTEGESAASKTKDSMENAADKSASAWQKVAGVVKAIAAAAVVKQIVNFGKEAIGLASDLTEVQNVIDVTFGEGNEKIETFSKTAARQFGLSELSAKKMAGTMGAMLSSMDVENVEDMSISLVGLAADMGSFYNMEAEEAFAKLRSGISGETEPLKQLGINMSVANLEAYALSQGMKKQFKDMTAAEQATLRYNYIMKATAGAQGDFARTSGSMANQLKLAKLNIEQVKASVGQALLPAATAATTAFNNLITNLRDAWPTVREGFENAVSGIGEVLDNLGITSRVKEMFSGLKTAANEAIGGVLSVAGQLGDSPVWDSLQNAMSGVVQKLLGLWDSVRDAVGVVLEILAPVWEGLKAGADDFIKAFVQIKTTTLTILGELAGIIAGVFDLITGIIAGDGEKVKNAVIDIVQGILNIGTALMKGIAIIAELIWKGITDAFSKIKQYLTEKFKDVDLKATGKKILESLKEGLTTGWELIKTWYAETKEKVSKKLDEWHLKETGSKILNSLKEGLIEKWGEISGWLDEKKQAVIDFFDGIDLKEIGKNILGGLKEGLEEKWKDVVGWFENKINNLLGGLPDWLKGLLGVEGGSVTLSEPTPAKPTYDFGDPVQEKLLEKEAAAAQELENAAEKQQDAAEKPAMNSANFFAGGTKFGPSPIPPAVTTAAATVETVLPAVAETEAKAAATAEETAEILSESAEAEQASAEASQEASDAVLSEIQEMADDGIDFNFDTGGELLEAVQDEVDKAFEGQEDYIGEAVNAVTDFFANLLSDHNETLDKDLNGIDSHMVDGFNGVNGGGGSHTLLEEYDELMGLWSNNKDANGEWAADWSKGGIGDTLNQLIGGKMPGKYWADLTQEDRERMAGMTASEGYTPGMYTDKFKPSVTEPVEIPADLQIVGIEGSEEMTGEGNSVLDLASLREAIPDETIESWNSLNEALTLVYQTLSGGDEGMGLAGAFQGLNADITHITEMLPLFCSLLEESIPAAVPVALEVLGEATVDAETGETSAGEGNTLYTALGALKTVIDDIDAGLDSFCGYLREGIPQAINIFKTVVGKAVEGALSAADAANAAADAYNAWAAAIWAVVAALEALNELTGGGGGGGGGDAGGASVETFAAAHGGLVNGLGVVGERGPEIVSMSRNMNVFTNRALEIAQNRVAGQLSREYFNPGYGGQTSISNDNSRTATVNVGTVLGSDWLGNEINRRIERIVERELFYGS